MASERLAKCRDAATVLGGITEHVEMILRWSRATIQQAGPSGTTLPVIHAIESSAERLTELADEMRRSIAERRTPKVNVPELYIGSTK